MNRKFIFIISLISIAPFSFAERTLCPPNSAIHCTNGICTVDAPYSNHWQLFVTGHPNTVYFSLVYIRTSRSTAVCSYQYTRNHFITLNSAIPYEADVTAAQNLWFADKSGQYYNCVSKEITDCPLK